MDIRKLVTHLRAGDSDRRVSRDLGVGRITVRHYRRWAEQHGLLQGDLPSLEAMQRLLDSSLPKLRAPQNSSLVEGYHDVVVALRREGVEMKAIWHRLSERGFEGSYWAVYRFVKSLEESAPEGTVRVETTPGEEAQVDFVEVGLVLDVKTGRLRKAWGFVMTLSWSRHQYAELVFDQRVATWLGLHVRAFGFFGGSPRRVTTDNLKAAIVKAAWNDPVVNRSYGECAEHYCFLIAPCRPYTPQHKGKVESGVHYMQRNFLAGRSQMQGSPLELDRCNRELRQWCLEEAGTRRHGTTRETPLARFEIEREQLRPLPLTPYDLAEFKQVKLHRDCHVVFDNSYYSAPCRLIGETLWARGGLTTVRLYDANHQCVATHERSGQPGTRLTHPAHLPPYKLAGLMQTRESCLKLAEACGPFTVQMVGEILSHPVLDRLPTAGRLVRLSQRYSPSRLEAACARAISFGDFNFVTVKRILSEELDQQPLTAPAVAMVNNQPRPVVMIFARTPQELTAHLCKPERLSDGKSLEMEGVASWS